MTNEVTHVVSLSKRRMQLLRVDSTRYKFCAQSGRMPLTSSCALLQIKNKLLINSDIQYTWAQVFDQSFSGNASGNFK